MLNASSFGTAFAAKGSKTNAILRRDRPFIWIKVHCPGFPMMLPERLTGREFGLASTAQPEVGAASRYQASRMAVRGIDLPSPWL